MSARKLIAARDPWGFRPLCMGHRGDAVVFASESCALDAVGAEFERDLDPGEIVVVEQGEVRSIRENCVNASSHLCIFEYIYFARPDSVICGQSVHNARVEAGHILAREHPVEADVVVGVPDSGLDAAMGYAQESGIPYGQGFIKNRYIGRTFITPCYFGTPGIPDKERLIACHHSIEEKTLTGADSLGDALHQIAPNASCGFCDGCFTEHYPIPLR